MNKSLEERFAVLGARPILDKPTPVGQLYFPEWDRYETAFRGIFQRQYYANNGPLLTELEEKLESFLGVKHAMCVSNATFGLIIAAEAMRLSGKVIMPSFTFIASAQSLSWAGMEPVFCDIDPQTHQMDIKRLDDLVDEHVSGVMGVNLWGGACNPVALEEFARSRDLKLYFDSAHAFGCEIEGTPVAGFGNIEVFSFHATKILNATEGGCICTDDDELADRCRNIRPSYGDHKAVNITKVANARMSEAQAAIALLSLEDFPRNRQNNEDLFCEYEKGLSNIPGLRLIRPAGVTVSNYQYVVCEIDEAEFGLSRDTLLAILKAENINARRYFYPGTHRCVGFLDNPSGTAERLPVTERVCASCLQLPIGARVDRRNVEKICEIVTASQRHSAELAALLAKKPELLG